MVKRSIFLGILISVFVFVGCKRTKKEAPKEQDVVDTLSLREIEAESAEVQVVEAKDHGVPCNPESSVVFSFKTLDGNDIDICDYRGKVVILDFWATWCGPCRMEIPGFIDIQNKYSDKVQIIGLAVSDKPERVRQFAQTFGMNYPVGMAPPEVLRMPYFAGIRYIPTTFIIDKEGKVRYRQVGYASKDFFIDWIERLYAEK